MSVNEKMTAIADAIREKTGETEILSLDDMALKIPKVYEKGYSDGQSQDSSDSYYDTFWDSFQDYGNRKDYRCAFAGVGWTDIIFKPKFDMYPTSAVEMFQNAKITNLKKILEDAKLELSFSNCTTLQYAFQNSQITHIRVIDARKCSNLNYFMPDAKFVYIEKLILKEDGTQTFTSNYSFSSCDELEHMIVEGVIGKNGFDLHWSTKLDADSLGSIINCLSTSTTGLTVTLPTTAKTNYDAVRGDGAWETLVSKKSNWTIAYMGV